MQLFDTFKCDWCGHVERSAAGYVAHQKVCPIRAAAGLTREEVKAELKAALQWWLSAAAVGRLKDAYREGFRDAAMFEDVETAWSLSRTHSIKEP